MLPRGCILRGKSTDEVGLCKQTSLSIFRPLLSTKQEHGQGGLQHVKVIAFKSIEKTSIKPTWEAFDPFIYSQRAYALSRTWN